MGTSKLNGCWFGSLSANVLHSIELKCRTTTSTVYVGTILTSPSHLTDTTPVGHKPDCSQCCTIGWSKILLYIHPVLCCSHSSAVVSIDTVLMFLAIWNPSNGTFLNGDRNYAVNIVHVLTIERAAWLCSCDLWLQVTSGVQSVLTNPETRKRKYDDVCTVHTVSECFIELVILMFYEFYTSALNVCL